MGLGRESLEHHAAVGRAGLWFPSLSGAAGTQPLGTPGITDESFAAYGTNDSAFSPLGTETHSYMRLKPFSEVWGGFARWRDLLRAPVP